MKKNTRPKELPIIGSAHKFGKDPLAFMTSLQQFGDVAEYSLFGTPFMAVFSPKYVEQILIKNANQYRKGEFIRERWKDFFGEGVVTADGEKWKTERKAMQPFMSPQKVASYFDLILKQSLKYVSDHQDGEVLDLKKDMTNLMLYSLVGILFRSDLPDEKIKQMGKSFDICVDYFNYTLQPKGILLRHFPTSEKKKYMKAIQNLENDINELTQKANPEDNNILSSLKNSLDENGKPFSSKLIRDNLLTFFIAGHETSSLTVCYALYLLSTHEDELKYVQEEIDSVLKGRLPSLEDLGQLPRIKNLLNETMRLYPSVPFIGREALTDDMLGSTKVPKGMNIMISAYNIHRNPDLYENPESFNPRRWEKMDPLSKRGEFMPFGTGPRLCMGAGLAMMEMSTILILFLQRFDFKLVSPPDFGLFISLAMRPVGDICVKIQNRSL